MPTLRYVVVDVFTDAALRGNQLAVFTDGRGLDDQTMQDLALELNLSETTFVFPPDAGGTVRLRIFTPASEMQFAGHPVLGTAWVLALPLQRDLIDCETGSGIVPVELERDETGTIVFGRMIQPVPTIEPYEQPEELLAALGVERAELPIEVYDNGARHTLVTLGSPEQVARLDPDLRALAALEVMASCFAGAGTDWKTRMFAPFDGVPEDPATGSAAGPIACHLARHGRVEWGQEIVISQGVELRRPSTLFARAEGGEGTVTQVTVGGRAVIVARGEFRLPG